jgi:hypothetical protein
MRRKERRDSDIGDDARLCLARGAEPSPNATLPNATPSASR